MAIIGGQSFDLEIYIQINGEMMKAAEPTCSPEANNFVITYQGKDWSGFRTLKECEDQFPQLKGRKGDPFSVVQR